MGEIPEDGMTQTAIAAGSGIPLGSYGQYIGSYGPTLTVYSPTEPTSTNSSIVKPGGVHG